MKLTKRQLKQIIKEELGRVLREDMDEELMQVMSVVLDQDLDPGTPAQVYLDTAMKGRARLRGWQADDLQRYIKQHPDNKEKLLAAMEAEMENHLQQYQKEITQ